MGLLSAHLADQATQKANKKGYKRQKEFAQNTIQWRVADAAAAGINPYFALGAPSMSYQDTVQPEMGLPRAIEGMGQDVSRAMTANAETASSKLQAQLGPLAVERASLENDFLRVKIASEGKLAMQAGGLAGNGVQIPVTIPGTNIRVNTADPNAGQTVENWIGDGPLSWAFNTLTGLIDMANTSNAGARRVVTSRNEIMRIFNALVQLQKQTFDTPWPKASSVPTMDLPPGGL